MEEKEQDCLVVAPAGEFEFRRVIVQRSHGRMGRKFLAEVVKLYLEHVDYVERPACIDAARQFHRKIAIDTGDLQSAAMDLVTELVKRCIAQPHIIAP